MVAYAFVTKSLELIEWQKSSQQKATMTGEMESLDEEIQTIRYKRFYEEQEGASSASRV